MVQSQSGLVGLFTGRFRWLVLGIAAVLLISVFVVWRFPYDRLAEYISVSIERQTGLSVYIEELGPALHLQGPGVSAAGVRILSDGDTLLIDTASLRPAWAFSWLRGQPTLHAKLAGGAGSVEGDFTTGVEPGFAGTLEDVDMTALPSAWLQGIAMDGRADIEVDLKSGPSGPEGWLKLDVAEGSLALGDFPMAVPFDRLTGSLTLGGDKLASIDSFDLEGPLLVAQLTGSIGRAPAIENAPLDLQIQVEAMPAIQPALASAGVRLDGNGNARLRISGTPAEPVVR